VGFYPWSRSYLGPAYARNTEASTSFPVAPRAPGFGMTCASLACARPPPGAPDRVFHASRPSRGVVSCVALGLPGHPPKGVVPRYPPRGVLRDWSRPVPGSCRGVVSPLTGGFPHNVTNMRSKSQRDRIRLAQTSTGARWRFLSSSRLAVAVLRALPLAACGTLLATKCGRFAV